jgi:hypothetical protein
VVPGKIFESEKVNFSTSPFGTPGCSTLAESTEYRIAGDAAMGRAGACAGTWANIDNGKQINWSAKKDFMTGNFYSN